MSIREQHEAAYLERQELRRGDSTAGPRECCGHEARNHGPKGCAMPGCGCGWPRTDPAVVRYRLEQELRAELVRLAHLAAPVEVGASPQKWAETVASELLAALRRRVVDTERGVWVDPVALYGRRGKCAACGHEWEVDSSGRGGGHFCPRQ